MAREELGHYPGLSLASEVLISNEVVASGVHHFITICVVAVGLGTIWVNNWLSLAKLGIIAVVLFGSIFMYFYRKRDKIKVGKTLKSIKIFDKDKAEFDTSVLLKSLTKAILNGKADIPRSIISDAVNATAIQSFDNVGVEKFEHWLLRDVAKLLDDSYFSKMIILQTKNGIESMLVLSREQVKRIIIGLIGEYDNGFPRNHVNVVLVDLTRKLFEYIDENIDAKIAEFVKIGGVSKKIKYLQMTDDPNLLLGIGDGKNSYELCPLNILIEIDRALAEIFDKEQLIGS